MKRILVVLCLMFITPLLVAAESPFKDGVQYYTIKPVPPVTKDTKVELLEFFWYGCPHCYSLEPTLNSWIKNKKPDNIIFKKMPIIFGGNAVTTLHAETYYALDLMGEAERLHPLIFKAMHKDRIRLRTVAKIKEFIAQNGVDADKFEKVMKSFAVQSKVRRSGVLALRYGVTGVPALIIDERYRSGGGMKSYDDMFDMISYLNKEILADKTPTSLVESTISQVKSMATDKVVDTTGTVGHSTISNTANNSGSMLDTAKSAVTEKVADTVNSTGKKILSTSTTGNTMVDQIKNTVVDKATETSKGYSTDILDKAETGATNFLKKAAE